MFDVDKFAADLFDDEDQAHAALYAGFLDHNEKVQAATDLPATGPLGALATAMKADTAALAVEARAAQENLNVAERAQVAASGDAADGRATAEKALSRIGGLITGVITDPKEQDRLRKLLFPQGAEQYTDAKLGDLAVLLAGFLSTLRTHKAAFGVMADTVVSQTETAFAAFTGTRAEHVTEQTDTAKARETRQALRARLTGRLTDNYHLLSLIYAANRAQVKNYFTQRYFERRRVSNPVGERRRAVQATHTQTLLDLGTYTAPERYHAVQLRLTEGGPAHFYRATAAADPEPTNALVLPPGPDALHVFRLADVPGTGPRLMLRNPSGHVIHVELVLLEE